MPTYREVISNDARGLVAAVARAALRLLSWPYGAVVALRNGYYDSYAAVHWPDRPCISIGNITAGGTGKTPVIMWLAERLIADGRRVAILSRGYKGDHSGNDELRMVSNALPQAVCVVHADRVQAARFAVQQHAAEVILLDDGFQHRRLGRSLDIVLIDASCPLGYGHLLPRGLLREPARGLRRAQVIVITRLSLCAPEQLATLRARCRKLAPQATLLGCDHRPSGLVDLHDRHAEISELAGRQVLLFSGIGHPHAFEQTVANLGAKPVHSLRFPDHHAFTSADCARICATAERAGADLILMTEKDRTKVQRLSFAWSLPPWALQIKIDFGGNGGKMLLNIVQELLSGTDDPHGPAPLSTD